MKEKILKLETKIKELMQPRISDDPEENLSLEKAQSEVAEISKSNSELKSKLIKAQHLSRKQNERLKCYQKKLSNTFCPATAKSNMIHFLTSHTGLSRYNLTSKMWHDKNKDAALHLFGFNSFDETLLYIQAFFQNVKIEFPSIFCDKNKICIKPTYLTDIEQILIAKMFMQSFTHRTKCSLVVNISRQCVSYAAKKWSPMWAAYGAYLSILPMPHDYYKKESPEECKTENLNNVTHLFDEKDIIIEIIRNNDNLRRRVRSEKVSDSACKTINFSTPMGLSFEHARAVGARASEKKIVQWWGSATPHSFSMNEYNNYFVTNDLETPKPHWTAKELDF